MKLIPHPSSLIPLLLLSSLIPLPSSLSAAVPLRWTVETSRAQPATFDEFAGATYGLEATLQSYGRPLEVAGEPHLYWQTNGMGSAYWSAPATVSGNVLRATWTPSCDVGARVYNCFIGITGTVYNAAFQLRLRPSPGAVPNELPIPTPVIDFSKVTVLNPPWPSGVDINAVMALVADKRDKTDLAVYEDVYGEWEFSDGVERTLYKVWFEDRYWWNDRDPNWPSAPGVSPPPDTWYGDSWSDEITQLTLEWYTYDEPKDNIIATRRKTPEPTSDTLALTSSLTAKRDLDDLAYVTAVPGGWTPTEVDGHRYDIYYDGYSGWYVEKLTYYPEWGEWYYEDSEWVDGPEDAETLVAHKIWSDETITFARQQVEVRDSLALVSQIGNQAEIAARNYIQNNDIAKTKTLLRTGKPGEYGTGWGTMHYQFSSDRRWWSMIVPTLTASWSTGGYVGQDGNYVSASTVNFPGSSDYYRADPIGQRDHTPVARFIASSGTNGSARCSAATWSVGITAGSGTSSSSVRFDNSADLGSMPFLVTADVDHSAGFGRAVREDRSAVPAIEFDLQDYNRDHYVIGNFRYGEMTMTDRAVSVKCLYDVAVSNTYTRAVAQSTAWCTLNLGCSAESYITTNPDYGRVLTDTTRGLYYDPGLKATWRVAVTNGCFFTEIVSTNNVTEGVN